MSANEFLSRDSGFVHLSGFHIQASSVASMVMTAFINGNRALSVQHPAYSFGCSIAFHHASLMPDGGQLFFTTD